MLKTTLSHINKLRLFMRRSDIHQSQYRGKRWSCLLRKGEKRSPSLFNLPHIQLSIVPAHTANLFYKSVSVLNCFEVVGNKHFLTTENNYSNSVHPRRLSKESILTPPTLSTSHSIALKQVMSRIHMVKLRYRGTCMINYGFEVTKHLKQRIASKTLTTTTLVLQAE